jgi:hypothetical protein
MITSRSNGRYSALRREGHFRFAIVINSLRHHRAGSCRLSGANEKPGAQEEERDQVVFHNLRGLSCSLVRGGNGYGVSS